MEYNRQEVNRKEYEELFKWLFGKDVLIKEEQDIALSPYYEDINIYYTNEIYELFQTEPMKREGKIMQLGSQIFCEPNIYHTRLEHSKGAYRNCIEFLAIQYRKPEWRRYIEENQLKGYLVEKIKFMCVHDIGHSMFSHSIEKLIGDEKCNHEDIGQKIIQENKEVKKALDKIKADEKDSNLEGDGSLEFWCEGNIDFDRMDYLMRDRLYLGEEYKSDLDLALYTMADLKLIQEEGVYRYVYRPEALPYIEEFLKLRDTMYKTQYKNKQRKIRDVLGIEQNIRGIYDYENRYSKYKKEEPIYIEDKEGKIYTLDKFPDLQTDLSDDYKYGVFFLLPELKEQNIEQEKINQIQKMIEGLQSEEEIKENDAKVEHNRMNMFQTEHGDVNYALKMSRFFEEERE